MLLQHIPNVLSRLALRRIGGGVFVLLMLVDALPALAATPRLLVGRVHLRRDGTAAVPVILATRNSDGVAALAFRVESNGLTVIGAGYGAAVVRARAQLGVQLAPGRSGLQATVIPKFGLPLPVLRRGRVATVYVHADGPPTRIRRALRLTDVTFSDLAGRTIRPEGRPGER